MCTSLGERNSIVPNVALTTDCVATEAEDTADETARETIDSTSASVRIHCGLSVPKLGATANKGKNKKS